MVRSSLNIIFSTVNMEFSINGSFFSKIHESLDYFHSLFLFSFIYSRVDVRIYIYFLFKFIDQPLMPQWGPYGTKNKKSSLF